MTKLMEWLVAIGAVLGVWAAVVSRQVETDFTKQYMHWIVPAPLLFVVVFGMYAATVVLYRVFTFNNCEEAATELKKEIEMARRELTARGFVF